MRRTGKLRICFISMEAYAMLRPGITDLAGGAGFQLVEIARCLRDRGYPVSFVTGDFGQPFREEIEGITVLRANRTAHDRNYRRALANVGRLARAMRAARSDVYILRSTRFLGGQCWLLARLLRSRYGFMIANMSNCRADEREGAPGIFNRLYGRSLRSADLVTAQTRVQQEIISREFGVQAVLVPNGISLPPWTGPRLDVDHDVLWVGSLKPVKRPEQILALASRMPGRRFVVAGAPGQDRAYAERAIAQFAAAPNVEYLGFVPPDRIAALYGRTRLLLNTSLNEGFPNTFLGAWSQGAPTCSQQVDPDGVIGRFGLGAVHADPEVLADAMDRLLADGEAYRRASTACRDYVAAEHSLDVTVDALLAGMRKAGLAI